MKMYFTSLKKNMNKNKGSKLSKKYKIFLQL